METSTQAPSHDAVIHRLVERRAAERGDAMAWRDPERSVTYRELNARANAAARVLMAHGFRKGSHARVAARGGADLVTTLLAVLKAGGSYTLTHPDCMPGNGRLDIRRRPGDAYQVVDVDEALRGPLHSSPNLPVLMRPTDPAFTIDEAGVHVVVPHASVTVLVTAPELAATHGSVSVAEWNQNPFELWLALTRGATLGYAGVVSRAA